MRLSKEIQDVLVSYVNKNRAVEIEASEIGNELFMQVAREYVDIHGYLPDAWASHMRMVVARGRYIRLLVSEGCSVEDLSDLSLVDLRDMVSAGEYIEERVATPSGGVSLRRTALSAA